MSSKKEEYIVFESKGEPAKDLMGTAVVASIASAHPDKKIVVATSNPELWLHNPHIYRVYNLVNLQYFYDDFIDGERALIFKHDPYIHTDFLNKKKHVIDIWCEMCGVKRGKSMPSLHLTAREKEVAEKFVAMRGGKPTFIIQTNGAVGIPPYPTSFSRDIHMQTAHDVVLEMQKAGFVVLQLKGPGQETFPGAVPVELGLRETLGVIAHTDKRLFNDSTAHHASSALGMPSVITWNTLTPDLHGYKMHNNVFPITDTEFVDIQDSFVEEFRLTRVLPQKQPEWTKPLHRVKEIMEALGIRN